VLLVVASSCDLEKFCTLPDHALRCDGSRTTSLCCQVNRKASSPSDPRTAASSFYIPRLAQLQLLILPDFAPDSPVK
jgi:hypothetical protein